MMKLITKHLANDIPPIKFAMIDKCVVEKSALEAVNIKPLLCEFHAQKLITSRIKKMGVTIEIASSTEKKINAIQRSSTAEMAKSRIDELRSFCTQVNKLDFFLWFTDNFCSDWLLSWLDIGRPLRIGILNTNNPSESFFKTLLTPVNNFFLTFLDHY